jgi:sugar lactone lactonase YvrE
MRARPLAVLLTAAACIPASLTYEPGDGGGAGPGGEGGDGGGGGGSSCAACGGAACASDPRNCGRCGHDCLGGTCAGGACQPFLLTMITYGPQDIALVGDQLYFGVPAQGQGFVGVVPATGGSATILAVADPTRIAVAGGHVAWAGYDVVDDVPTSGGIPTILASGQHLHVPDVAADPAGVLYASNGGDAGAAIVASPFDGGAQVALVPSLGSAVAVTVDATHLYYADGVAQKIYRCNLDGSSPTVLASGQESVTRLFVDDTNIYWVGGGTADGFVAQTRLDGSVGVNTLASNLDSPFAVVSDGTNVYFSGPAANSAVQGMKPVGTVKSVPIGGGTVTILANTVSNAPAGVAVDSTAVYWADIGANRIMKLAK